MNKNLYAPHTIFLYDSMILKNQNNVDDSGKTSFDALLVAVGQDQDKDKFAALFEYFAPRIKSFLIQSGLSDTLADELAQETMLAVWDKASHYDPAKAAASTWIYRIARNKKIDYFRKKSTGETQIPDETLIEDDADNQASMLMQKQETDIMSHALAELPEEQSDLLARSFFKGQSHGEIAKETGIPLGTVKSRIRLALEKLGTQSSVRDLWEART